MQYRNLFAPKVRSFDVEHDGQKVTFCYRPPRAGEVMDELDAKDGQKLGRKALNAAGIKQWIVNEDGSAISDEQVTDIMAMEMPAFAKFSDKLAEVMGSKKAEGEQKNA